MKDLKQNEFYWYSPPYFKDWQIYQCTKFWFEESEKQYRANFICMTDTCYSNSIGQKIEFNEIEISNYIVPIIDLQKSIKTFEPHQISPKLLNLPASTPQPINPSTPQ